MEDTNSFIPCGWRSTRLHFVNATHDKASRFLRPPPSCHCVGFPSAIHLGCTSQEDDAVAKHVRSLIDHLNDPTPSTTKPWQPSNESKSPMHTCFRHPVSLVFLVVLSGMLGRNWAQDKKHNSAADHTKDEQSASKTGIG